MKKVFLISTSLVVALTACAQWNTDKSPIQVTSTLGAFQPKAALTADGKMFISWRTAKTVEGEALCYSFPHLQLLDKEGNALFGKSGLDVSNHKSPFWNSDYSLVITSDNCAVLSNADSRTEDSEILDRYDTFTPVWYKIGQNKDFLWGFDGVALNDRKDSPFTKTFVIGDDIWIQDQSNSPNVTDYFNRITSGGALAFAESQEVFGQMVQSIDDNFIMVKSGSKGPEAQRYNRDCQPVWSEPVMFASANSASRNLYPYSILSDGKGGAYIAWVRGMGDFGHMVCTQHIDALGTPTFGLDAMDVYATEDFDHDYQSLAVDIKNNRALVIWIFKAGGGTYNLQAQLFSEDGDRLFGETGKPIATKNDEAGYAFKNHGVLSVDDGEWLICYSDVKGWAKSELYIERLNKDGNSVWKQQIGDAGTFNDVSFIKGDDCSFIVYETKDEEGNKILKAARIYDDGAFVKTNTTSLPYSIDFRTSGMPTDWVALDKSTPSSNYGKLVYGEALVKINGSKTNTKCIFTGSNIDNTAWNDYYISPEFKLDANKAYKIKTQTVCDGDSYDVTLKYGTSTADDATFTKFANCTMQKNNFDTSKSDEVTLKVAESGVYRIAFHVTSTAGGPQDNVYLMSFSIKEDATSDIDNSVEAFSEIASITVHSIDGKLIQTVKGSKFCSASLVPGIYIITMKDTQGKTKSIKITK